MDTQDPTVAEIFPTPLTGRLVALEPLGHQHCAGLQEAVRDGELWEL